MDHSTLLFKLVDGQWPERAVMILFLVGIAAVTLLRLLVSYREYKDSFRDCL